MGFRDFINRVFDTGESRDQGLGVDELARRLGLSEDALRNLEISYHQFGTSKRSGGTRIISSPNRELKSIQRRILHRVLKRVPVHPAAVGFERGRSIVTNALPHCGKAIVLKMDVKDFFGSTGAHRVRELFERLGWNRKAAGLLTGLCTYEGALPQGAPTSPRLSNLVNARMDARLAAVTRKLGAAYTRYADDLTFSFAEDRRRECNQMIRISKLVLRDFGYQIHTRKKLQVRRRHQQQIVTGLVVNAAVRLPRHTRRWLRAVEHRQATARPGTLTPAQLEGWRSFQAMVSRQAGTGG
ncbi:MAG TPA: reverse transcriptase family protein [Blastocatellia bacterium]|nr:reverse transcriptase family protein [Blastocatellia bacterium]